MSQKVIIWTKERTILIGGYADLELCIFLVSFVLFYGLLVFTLLEVVLEAS